MICKQKRFHTYKYIHGEMNFNDSFRHEHLMD